MENIKYCSGNDYFDKFDPNIYLRRHAHIDNSRHMLRCFHGAFQTIPKGVSVLDYSSGPSVRGTISAATKASEIVLSYYSASNFQLARDWVEDQPHSFNWNPHFSFVVKDLEGGHNNTVLQRPKSVRGIIKGFAKCDVTQIPPIEEKYNKLYDVVISSYVLESVATSNEEYAVLMSRITRLVKPGGYFLLYGVEDHQRYIIGDHTFFTFPIASSVTKNALEKCGFSILSTDKKTQKTAHYVFFLAKSMH